MKSLLVLCFLILSGSFAMAQVGGEKKQEIENIRLAFISSKLNLTTEEAQRFWPIYNAYRNGFSEILRLKNDAKRQQSGDANQQLDKEIDLDERILELKKKYRNEFSKIIPPSKVLLFFEAEKEFRDHLIKQLKARRQQNN